MKHWRNDEWHGITEAFVENRVPVPLRTLTRELNMAFKIPYVYDFITQLCRKQAEVTVQM